ncbi:MAG: ImmA/IrrE family metallo-endopeptidase [Ilumatobacteraceae bacterium]
MAALQEPRITDRSFPLVFVRASQPRPRALFTLAHELAHVLAGDGDTFTVDEDLTAAQRP